MLHDQDLPKFLWAEACNTVVYLQNRSPHRVLGNITFEEAFTGKKPNISHLRIFSCILHCHIPAEKRTTLDPTAEKGILVGYNETCKSYRIYITFSRKTVEHKDVKFEEERAFWKSLQDKDIMKAKASQQEEVPTSQNFEPPLESQQEEEQPMSPRKKKPKWAEQLQKEASEQVKSPGTSVRTSIPPQRYS
jgi:hypothetical protein